jgi:hypothetical protein
MAGSRSAWALDTCNPNTIKRGGASIREAPGSSGWPRQSPLSRVCSKVSRSPSPVGTIAWEEILQSPDVLIGTVDQLAEDLQARRERWGISYYVIFEPYMDAFAPIVAHLAGR